MTQLNTAPQPPTSYPPMKLGLCRNLEDEQALLDTGFDPVWRIGNCFESLEYLVRHARKRRTVIGINEDLRVIGDSRTAILDTVRDLRQQNISLLDIRDNCSDELVLIKNTLRNMQSQAAMRNHRTARRRGSKGGLAKKLAAEATRNAILAHDIVMRLCAHPKLTKRDCAEILGPPFSLSTLIRNY